MAKVSYAKLNLKTNNEIKTFNFKDQEVEVLQYLPIEDKYDLIMVALQKAQENGIYNELKLDMYFHLNLVYLYTNLSFTDKQRENEYKIFDCLKSNGFFDAFLNQMNPDEYDELLETLNLIKGDLIEYNHSTSALVQAFISDLPKQAQAAKEIVDSFDPNKYEQVMNMAKASGFKA